MADSLWDGSKADRYDDRWQRLVESGQNPHGEADFVQRYDPATVLDAGCGTGRVAIELANRGVEVVGTDLDGDMLAVAQQKAPTIAWVHSDLADLDLGRTFDVVVMAGNVLLFVAPGSEAAVVAGAARHVAIGGRLIAGFQTDQGVTVEDFADWARAAGLAGESRFSTWEGRGWSRSQGYVVEVWQNDPGRALRPPP